MAITRPDAPGPLGARALQMARIERDLSRLLSGATDTMILRDTDLVIGHRIDLSPRTRSSAVAPAGQPGGVSVPADTGLKVAPAPDENWVSTTLGTEVTMERPATSAAGAAPRAAVGRLTATGPGAGSPARQGGPDTPLVARARPDSVRRGLPGAARHAAESAVRLSGRAAGPSGPPPGCSPRGDRWWWDPGPAASDRLRALVGGGLTVAGPARARPDPRRGRHPYPAGDQVRAGRGRRHAPADRPVDLLAGGPNSSPSGTVCPTAGRRWWRTPIWPSATVAATIDTTPTR